MGWIMEEARAMEARLQNMQDDLGEIPELGWNEVRTTAYVVRRLGEIGLDPKVFPRSDGPSVGAYADLVVDSRKPFVVVRADIDALNMPDLRRGDNLRRSKNEGVHHACGHNMHMAGLLGAAEIVLKAARGGHLHHNVRFLFEPAEELGNGASFLMREHNVLDRAVAVYGVHAWPGLRVGEVGLRDGAIQRSWQMVEGFFEGVDGHTARPHLTSSLPERIGKWVNDAKHELEGKWRWDDQPQMMTGKIEVGTAQNVYPRTGYTLGNVRAPIMESFLKAPDQLREISAHFAAMHAIAIALKFSEGLPPVINTHRDYLADVLAEEIGRRNIKEMRQLEGGDPFAYYHAGTEPHLHFPAVKGVDVMHYFQVGVADPDPHVPVASHPVLHQSDFYPTRGAVVPTAVVYSLAALRGIPPGFDRPSGRRSGAGRPSGRGPGNRQDHLRVVGAGMATSRARTLRAGVL